MPHWHSSSSRLFQVLIIVFTNVVISQPTTPDSGLMCEHLQIGQYYCKDPTIDPETQQAENCSKEYKTVPVDCYPAAGINCSGKEFDGETVGFTKPVPCLWTNGKKFNVAILLSIFLGWLGIDRFYLGYPAIGLVKFCTVGFMMLGSFVDVLLIATQAVGPADGSAYIVDYYGQGVERIETNNYTFIKPPDYG